MRAGSGSWAAPSSRGTLRSIRRILGGMRASPPHPQPLAPRSGGEGSKWCRSALVLAEAVAHAADRLDQVGRAELLAQRLDVDVDGPLQHDGPLADGGVHELVPAEGPA